MNTATNVVSSGLCIGCGYCAGLADGEMVLDTMGFLEPGTAGKTLDGAKDALVAAACPGLQGDHVVAEGGGPKGAVDDRMWGRHYRVVTAWSTDANVRYAGSSGGALTGLAHWLIVSGRVEQVLVTTYDANYPIGTKSEATSSEERLLAGAGSKYCPSSPLAAMSGLRDSSGPVAVIARPCDIATLRRAMAAGDPVASRIKILFSFFCAGTPSDLGNRALLTQLGVPGPEAVMRFRHRGNGWPGDTIAELAAGGAAHCTYNESWGKVLRKYTHHLCKICPDGIGEAADIVAADAWYGDDDGYPSFAEADGRSLVIARTTVGLELLAAAEKDGVLATEPLDVREIDRMQPGQVARRRQLAARLLAYRFTGHQVPTYNKDALAGYAHGLTLVASLRIFVATLRRLIHLRRRTVS